MNSTKRVLVVGAKFGEIYLNGLAKGLPGFRLAGLLANGSGRARQLAKDFDIPLYRRVEDVPADFDIACVVVRSTIVGGAGSRLAEAFLRRRMHVVQEHPVHPDEVRRLQALAIEHGVHYWINTFYSYARAGHSWISSARKLRQQLKSGPVYAQLSTSRQLLFSSLDLLQQALGQNSEPPSLTPNVRVGPFDRFSFNWNGTPVDISLQNYMDSRDPDQHSLIAHHCQLCWPEGTLTLAGSYGPVLWAPTFFDHGHQDTESTISSRMTGNSAFSSTVVDTVQVAPPDWKAVFEEDAPQAIADVFASLVHALQDGNPPEHFEQRHQHSVAQLWQQILRHVGPAKQVALEPPHQANIPQRLSTAESPDARRT